MHRDVLLCDQFPQICMQPVMCNIRGFPIMFILTLLANGNKHRSCDLCISM